MPTPAPPEWQFWTKPDALSTMAAAIGPSAYKPNGEPRQDILLGKRTGTASKQLSGRHPASARTVATASARLAEARGIPNPHRVTEDLFDIVLVGSAA